MTMLLETDRLILRPWTQEDAPSLFKYASDPEVGVPAGWPPHTSVEVSADVIRCYFSAPDTFAVVLKSTDEPVGCIGLVPPGDCHYSGIAEGEREVGYWIGKPYWGLGLIPEALQALVDYCRALSVSRLWILTYTANAKSRRVAEKSGFTFDGYVIDSDDQRSAAYYMWLDRQNKCGSQPCQ